MSVVDAELQERCQVSPIRPIPKGWDEKTLLDAVGMKKDLIVAGPFGSNLKVSDYRNEGIPIIRLQNIDYGKFIDKEIKYISPEKARELAYHSFRAGDLVLAKLGDPIGKTCKVPDYFKDGIVVADVVRIRVENGWADTKFIMYSLNSVAAKKQLINGKIGSTRPRVNLDQIRGIRILVPPLNQQRKIAAILSSVDAAIEQTDAIIAQTERMKVGLMKDLFIKGINHKKFKNSPIGRIPLEWEAVKIEDLIKRKIISEIQDGNHGELHPKEGDFQDEGIPFVTANCLNHGRINFDNAKFLDSGWLKKLRIGFAKPGDLLLTHKGTIGQTNILGNEYSIVILSPQVTYYRISDPLSLHPDYLYTAFQSHNFQDKIKQLSMQSTRAYLSITQQKSIFIPLPAPAEQRRISEINLAIDGKLENEREHKLHLSKIKSGLMQVLLTGRIRVRVDGHA